MINSIEPFGTGATRRYCGSNSDGGWICELLGEHDGDHACGSPQAAHAANADHRWSEPHNPLQAERNLVLSHVLDGVGENPVVLSSIIGIEPRIVSGHLRALVREGLA